MARSEWGKTRRHLARGQGQRDPLPEQVVLGWLWRHAPELLGVLLVGLAWYWLSTLVGHLWTAVVFVVAAGNLAGWPKSRRGLLAGLGCWLTRHRLRRAFLETRTTNRAGQPPLLLAVCPTPVGERVRLWCRAGISAEDIEDQVDQLRSACAAREVRVVRDRRWSALVVVDVIRRDTLAARRVVPAPVVLRMPARYVDEQTEEVAEDG